MQVRTGVGAACALAIGGAANAGLIGVNFSTGTLYAFDPDAGSIAAIGETGRTITGLEVGPAGALYGMTDGLAGRLVTIDPETAGVTDVGPLGAGFSFEGALAIDAAGRAVGATKLAGGGRALFSVDLTTGATATLTGLSRSSIDINGMVFRDDGALVGIDSVRNEFVSIDLATGAVTTISALQSPGIGAVGGLALHRGMGYYATAGAVSGSDGDNALYSIDLYTGEQAFVMSLGSEAGAGFGIGALASTTPVPAPSAALPLALGAGGALRRRRR
ncbi:MAG: DUF6923 family protein [Phycisphaerales bacterium]